MGIKLSGALAIALGLLLYYHFNRSDYNPLLMFISYGIGICTGYALKKYKDEKSD